MILNLKNSAVKETKGVDELTIEEDVFQQCEHCDIFMEDMDVIKAFLDSVANVYRTLSESDKKKGIYINITHWDKIPHASHEKDWLLLPDSINEFLAFSDEEELEECAKALVERFRIRQEEDMKRRSI